MQTLADNCNNVRGESQIQCNELSGKIAQVARRNGAQKTKVQFLKLRF
jgi:hypothetical protein